jgi:hypothetical protein
MVQTWCQRNSKPRHLSLSCLDLISELDLQKLGGMQRRLQEISAHSSSSSKVSLVGTCGCVGPGICCRLRVQQ